MKIGPFQIGRAAAAAQPQPHRETGASGTVNLNGFLQELEYNDDLVGERGLQTWERMRSSDGAVAESLGHITAPIRNATWEIQPDSDDPLDLEIAEAVRRAYFEWPVQPFSEYLDQALDYLVFGHMVFERGEQVIESGLEFEDATAEPELDEKAAKAKQPLLEIAPRQFLTWRRFAQRLPATITKWNSSQGELQSIEQQVWKDDHYETVPTEAQYLIVLVNQRRGDDFTGRSLLRGAWKHWVMKELVEKIEAVALERHGVGVWIAYPPSSRRDDAGYIERLEEILQNIRAGAMSYIVATDPKAMAAAQGGEGVLFECIRPEGVAPDFTAAINRHRGDIKGSMLVRFSELGHAEVGARSTGDTQSKVWDAALHTVARHISEVNAEQIKWFVDVNYGHDRYPTLVAQDIESRSLVEFAEAHSKLLNAGNIEADRTYRAYVRKATGSPPEDDPTKSDREAAEQAEREKQLLEQGPPAPPIETE